MVAHALPRVWCGAASGGRAGLAQTPQEFNFSQPNWTPRDNNVRISSENYMEMLTKGVYCMTKSEIDPFVTKTNTKVKYSQF